MEESGQLRDREWSWQGDPKTPGSVADVEDDDRSGHTVVFEPSQKR